MSKEFKIKINKRDIAEIVDSLRDIQITDVNFIRTTQVDDIFAARVLLALTEFLKARRCEPDFEVVLGE